MKNNIFINRDGLQIPYSEVIIDISTKYQKLQIFQTEKFGKMIALDGTMFQAEQGDELTEMAVHLPLNVGSSKKKIVAIGSGDGFALKELVKHKSLEEISLVEIDEELLDICKKIFPFDGAWQDKRINTYIQDGFVYLKHSTDKFDLIISTPANTYTKEGEENIAYKLFTSDYFNLAFDCLADDGIFVTDGSTAYYSEKEPNWVSIYGKLKEIFPIVKPYFFASKRMPGGSFVLLFASKKYDPIKDFQLNQNNIITNYYNSEIHKASFCLPEFLKRKIQN
jgi:spermidine synthase